MAASDTAVKALNDLIATNRDAEEGYAKAAKGVHHSRLSDRLVAISGARGKFADELTALISDLGAHAAPGAHIGGILHPGWVDLETRIRSKPEIEIVQECRIGDEATLKHYRHALSVDMPQPARVVVERQLEAVESDLHALEDLMQKGRVQHA